MFERIVESNETIVHFVASMSDARLDVTLEQDGSLDAVTKPVGTAAYRIVQESLTNVIRHAGAATTVVRLAADEKRTTVEVSDDGPGGASAAGTGMGIRGMRERAYGTGATLEVGPHPVGGLTVRATWDHRP